MRYYIIILENIRNWFIILYRIFVIFNNLIKYNFISLIFIEILYNFRIREIFNLLRMEDLNAIIIKIIFIDIIIIYLIIKSITRII